MGIHDADDVKATAPNIDRVNLEKLFHTLSFLIAAYPYQKRSSQRWRCCWLGAEGPAAYNLENEHRRIQWSYITLLKESLAVPGEAEPLFYAEKVSKATKEMGLLIEALLNFAHLGQLDMALTTAIDVKHLINDVRDSFSNETKNRNITWIIHDLGSVTADKTLLRQIFANLIENAIKYSTLRSPAVIEVGCKDEDVEYVFFVCDNGIGFDMKNAGKLFSVFQRLHRSEEFKGVGIGLANVRKIVQRHGGRTWAESKPDQGAVFYFTLPKEQTLHNELQKREAIRSC